MNVRVSILLINLNTLEYTKQCFFDLLNQTVPFNLTIVDQNSSENGTRVFLETLQKEYELGKFFNKINVLKIFDTGYNKPINHIWNKFVESSNTEFICLLNNDVRIAPNFLESSYLVLDKEPSVGFVNHTTNTKKYSEWSNNLQYVIKENPYRQGWDPIFRKESFTPIPENLEFYYGDDFLYSNLYSKGKKGAYVLNSPIIHFLSKTTSEKSGVLRGNIDKENFNELQLPIQDLSFDFEFSKWSPEFFEIKKKNMNTLKINNVEYDMSSPIDDEYIKKNMNSFGDNVFITPDNLKTSWYHIDGFELHLNCDEGQEFDVKIFDNDDNLLYETKLKNNMFCKLSRKYFNGIKYQIYSNSTLLKEEIISFSNKRVYISFDSSSLGDTISWVPYCEQFRQEHNCEVIVSTYHNHLFEQSYKNLTFVKPGEVVKNIHGMFSLGWFYDKNKEPIYPPSVPLQKSACNILGLKYTEIQTKINFEPKSNPFSQKYICIATNSTAGCKLWNYPNAWEILSSELINLGYKVVNISKNGDKIKGVTNLKDDSMSNTMNVIYHSEFVIGLSSGLSWLSWGLDKHVVMISNFTEPNHEFNINCTRLTNSEVCNGCWNNPQFKFDKGDWNWCPEHKGTQRQFECHKSITPDMVLTKIKKWL